MWEKPWRECTGAEISWSGCSHLVCRRTHRRAGPGERQHGPLYDASRHRPLMPCAGDRPDVVPEGCVNFAFLGQFAQTERDTIFTTEYSVRTAMEAVYTLLM